jgi:hypothetical protein
MRGIFFEGHIIINVYALTVFSMFYRLVDENKTQSFSLLLLKLLTNFENPSSNPLQKP